MARADAPPDPREPLRDIAVPGGPSVHAPARDTAEIDRAEPGPRRVIRERVKILFVAANSRAEPQLALNEEYRTIADKIRGARFRDAFELVPEIAARESDLQRALLQHAPDIVHFACHGSADAELLLLREDGTSGPVVAETLAEYFGILRDNLSLVVLNACFSSVQAAAVRNIVDITIGLRERIADTAAIGFSGAFYEALAYGRSVREAFRLGRLAAARSGSTQGTALELFERERIDASTICYAGESSTQAPAPPRARSWRLVAIAAAGAGAVVAWRWSTARHDPPRDPVRGADAAAEVRVADPLVDAPAPVAVPFGMVRLRGGRVRPGVFDGSQRPAACADLTPSEDCASRQDPREIPEIELDDFDIDRTEVTNHDFADWLNRTSRVWRRNDHDRAVIETSTEPSAFLVRTGDKCGLVFVGGRVHPQMNRTNQPATCMTWIAARDYCLSHPDRKRLPLDVEWEFAAKGPEGRAFPWGASLPRPDGVAFSRGSSLDAHPADVGASRQDVSAQGIYDLGGNVAEWVEDDRLSGQTQMIRGGSWNSRGPCHLLSSGCQRVTAESFAPDVGFRCAKTAGARPR